MKIVKLLIIITTLALFGCASMTVENSVINGKQTFTQKYTYKSKGLIYVEYPVIPQFNNQMKLEEK